MRSFLSKEHLLSDYELSSEITDDFQLPISIIMKRLSITFSKYHQVIKILEDIEFCELINDNTQIKLNYPKKTIICKDVPSDFLKSDLEGLFSDEVKKQINICHKESDSLWFVSFNSEDMALKAIDESSGFNQIKCRLKNEKLINSDQNKNEIKYYAPNYNYGYYDETFNSGFIR